MVVMAEVKPKPAQKFELITQKDISGHHTLPAERHEVHVERAAAVQTSLL